MEQLTTAPPSARFMNTQALSMQNVPVPPSGSMLEKQLLA